VNHLSTRFRVATLAKQIERNAAKPTIDDAPADPRALPGDPIRLRGIPVVGRGVAGATRGSSPHQVA